MPGPFRGGDAVRRDPSTWRTRDDALQRCHRYLTPGGHLFITTPDTSAPVARLLGSHWYYIDLLEHVSLFSPANLTRLLAECGFRVVERRTIGRRYASRISSAVCAIWPATASCCEPPAPPRCRCASRGVRASP